MKALRTLNHYPPGSLMNPSFRYKNASQTNIQKTFERVRREQAKANARADQPTLPLMDAIRAASAA